VDNAFGEEVLEALYYLGQHVKGLRLRKTLVGEQLPQVAALAVLGYYEEVRGGGD
jgi:hypothetical protein